MFTEAEKMALLLCVIFKELEYEEMLSQIKIGELAKGQTMNIHDAVIQVMQKYRGRSNRISRKDLRNRVGYYMTLGFGPYPTDRSIRMEIEDLRRTHPTGALICSSSGVAGYWIAEDMNELLESYREERRRAINILVTIRARLRRGKIAFSGQQQLL